MFKPFIFVIEFLCILIGLWVLLFQIIIPFSENKPYFPYFRKKRKIKDKISEVEEKILEKKLENKLKKTKEKLDEF